MSISTLNIRVTPRRMLPLRDAAEYTGIAAKRLAGVCPVTPIEMPDGSRLYDMRDLDAWIDGLKSGDATGDDELIGKLG
ncbi:hypothetical protein [Mesorhizobium sp. M0088]|uniref:hypothetical protein n=1 Tax=Mesorhizobium sp. M0088 TaxID=2956873 RepID=UPI00333AD6B3